MVQAPAAPKRGFIGPSSPSNMGPTCFPCRAGGSGKTTMAIRLYDRLTNPFPQRAEVRLDADDTLGKESKRHLVSALKQLGATGVDDADDAAQLLTRLRELVAAGPVLLFVDNVWTGDQLDGLLPISFHPSSLVIITSRFADLRASASYRVSGSHGLSLSCGVVAITHSQNLPHPQALAPKLLSYKVEMLSKAAARRLFQQCAGRQGATDAGPAGLEGEVVRSCGGLPLALVLAGGRLWREGNPAIWQARPRCNHASARHLHVAFAPTMYDKLLPCRRCSTL